MVSLIAVITALALFMAVLPIAFESPEEDDAIPLVFLKGLSVSGGELHSETDLDVMREDMGFSALKLNVRVSGEDTVHSFVSGEPATDEIVSSSGTFLLKVDKGRTISSYELAVWK